MDQARRWWEKNPELSKEQKMQERERRRQRLSAKGRVNEGERVTMERVGRREKEEDEEEGRNDEDERTVSKFQDGGEQRF